MAILHAEPFTYHLKQAQAVFNIFLERLLFDIFIERPGLAPGAKFQLNFKKDFTISSSELSRSVSNYIIRSTGRLLISYSYEISL